jgi:hypothetical protein
MKPTAADIPEPVTSRTGAGHRRISGVLLVRLGIAGFFLAASAVSLVSFTLFGCYCFEGLTVQKPDDRPVKDLPPGPNFSTAEPAPPK